MNFTSSPNNSRTYNLSETTTEGCDSTNNRATGKKSKRPHRKTAAKANWMLGLVRHSFKHWTSAFPGDVENINVRSRLGCVLCVASLYLRKDIEKKKYVQRPSILTSSLRRTNYVETGKNLPINRSKTIRQGR